MISTYDAVLDPNGMFEGLTGADARLGMVTTLVAGTSTGAVGEESAGAKLDLYEMALRDLPPWAIARAIERWARGEVPQSIVKVPQFQYTPAAQNIRALALLEVAAPKRAREEAVKVSLLMTSEAAMDPAPIVAGLPRLGGTVRPLLRKM